MKENYVIYDYISINVKKDLETMYIDCYKNFGWIHINNNARRDYYINSNSNPNTVDIKFKRHSDIKNKEELQRLQKRCEKAFITVNKLEKMPQLLATMYALIVGFIATAFIAMAVFNIIKGALILAIICIAIGFSGYIFPYFVYKNVKVKKEIENKTKITEQQNIIYDIYKNAKKILLEDE